MKPKYTASVIILFAAATLQGCSNSNNSSGSSGSSGTTTTNQTLPVVTHTDTGFEFFTRKIDVFGVPIYAAPLVEENKLIHAANVMAQYLDNDEDGAVDNQRVIDAMRSSNAAIVMWKVESDLERGVEHEFLQDLGADETVPEWHTNGQQQQFDASLEEVWHVITHAGYANAYPDHFGEVTGTTLTTAMDTARGGQFTTIPNPYPAGAWYTYDDTTCDYNCMATEYVYWAMSSMLGAQTNRLSEISGEWRLNTRTLVEQTDTAVFALLTDSRFNLPTVLPDGSYEAR